MNRIIALDIAKAICIILVVMGHYVPDNSPAWYVLVHDVIYTFHMPLFMFVSGYASAILVIFSGVIIPMLLYRFVLKKHRITKLLFGL